MRVKDLIRSCPMQYGVPQKVSPASRDSMALLDHLVQRGLITKKINTEQSDRQTVVFDLALTDVGRKFRDGGLS